MKLIIVIALSLLSLSSFAETKKMVRKTTTTTKSSEYVAPESTDQTIINKKTKVNPGTINADGSVTPATQTTTTKKTRKY